ncbi:uncharacterized protein LOC142906545 isoform X1 [Petromyzon marinus]|uniref:uncharacterized protein LOC142906545 isoform X1 n=1 Tax=Petromyzon marinus TaxID=7757 RepID=UPI003F6F71B4
MQTAEWTPPAVSPSQKSPRRTFFRRRHREDTWPSERAQLGQPEAEPPEPHQRHLFGCPMEDLWEEGLAPRAIRELLGRLWRRAPWEPGVFRRSPGFRTSREIRNKINANSPAGQWEHGSPVALATILKEFLRSVPGGFFPRDSYEQWVAAVGCPDDPWEPEATVRRIETMLCSVSLERRALIGSVFRLLRRVADNAHWSHMTSFSLSVCTAPSMLWAPGEIDRRQEGDVIDKIVAFVQFLIDHCHEVFGEVDATDDPNFDLPDNGDRGDAQTSHTAHHHHHQLHVNLPLIAESDLQLTPDPSTDIQLTPNTNADVKLTPELTTDIELSLDPNTEPKITPDLTAEIQLSPDPSTDLKLTPDLTTDIQLTPDPHTDLKLAPDQNADLQLISHRRTHLKFHPIQSVKVIVSADPTAHLPFRCDPSTGVHFDPNPTSNLQLNRDLKTDVKSDHGPSTSLKSVHDQNVEVQLHSDPDAHLGLDLAPDFERDNEADAKEPDPDLHLELSLDLDVDKSPRLEAGGSIDRRLHPDSNVDPAADLEPVAVAIAARRRPADIEESAGNSRIRGTTFSIGSKLGTSLVFHWSQIAHEQEPPGNRGADASRSALQARRCGSEARFFGSEEARGSGSEARFFRSEETRRSRSEEARCSGSEARFFRSEETRRSGLGARFFGSEEVRHSGDGRRPEQRDFHWDSWNPRQQTRPGVIRKLVRRGRKSAPQEVAFTAAAVKASASSIQSPLGVRRSTSPVNFSVPEAPNAIPRSRPGAIKRVVRYIEHRVPKGQGIPRDERFSPPLVHHSQRSSRLSKHESWPRTKGRPSNSEPFQSDTRCLTLPFQFSSPEVRAPAPASRPGAIRRVTRYVMHSTPKKIHDVSWEGDEGLPEEVAGTPPTGEAPSSRPGGTPPFDPRGTPRRPPSSLASSDSDGSGGLRVMVRVARTEGRRHRPAPLVALGRGVVHVARPSPPSARGSRRRSLARRSFTDARCARLPRRVWLYRTL